MEVKRFEIIVVADGVTKGFLYEEKDHKNPTGNSWSFFVNNPELQRNLVDGKKYRLVLEEIDES